MPLRISRTWASKCDGEFRRHGVDPDGVSIGAEKIRARTAFWAAGNKASPVGAFLGAPLDRAGRIQVNPDLSVPGHPEIFVVGDLAALVQDGRQVPGVGPAAIQEGSLRREEHRSRSSETAAEEFPVPEQGRPRDDREITRDSGSGVDQVLRPIRVVLLALRSYHVSGRLSQSAERAVRVGVRVLHVSAWRAADHGYREAPASSPSDSGGRRRPLAYFARSSSTLLRRG